MNIFFANVRKLGHKKICTMLKYVPFVSLRNLCHWDLWLITLGQCDKCLKMTTNIKYFKFICLVLKPGWCLFDRDCPFYRCLYLNGVPNSQREFVVAKYILIESKTESFLGGNSIPQFSTIIVAPLNIALPEWWIWISSLKDFLCDLYWFLF